MKDRKPVHSWRIVLLGLLAGTVACGLACFPQKEPSPRLRLTAETLDRIDADMERLAAGRWPSWSMEVSSGLLAFHVDVADTPAAEACSGIGEVVRLAGDDITWSAELTRGGQPLTRCGSLDLLAGGRHALRSGGNG